MILIKIDERLTTNFQPADDSDVINKADLDEKIKIKKGSLIHIIKRLERI